MKDFVFKILIYILGFVLSFYGLNALDFNKFIRQGRVRETWVLYFVLACSLAYLFGSFVISIIYKFNW